MPRIFRTAALLALLCAPLLLPAQPLAFGEPLPLTNTRYGTAVAQPMVETNGKSFFLFWQTENNLRVTRVVAGEPRAGRHVLDNGGYAQAAVTWTGTHFLVVSKAREGVVARLLDANAEPAGEPFVLDTGQVEALGLASNGATVLLLYTKGSALEAMALTPHGVPTGVRSTLVPQVVGVSWSDVASNGTGFAAVAATSSGVLAITFDGDGRERSREVAYAGSYPNVAAYTAIASNGSDYLAAWQLANGGSVQAARILPDGSVRPAVTLQPSAPDGSFHSPIGAAWTGAHWAVAYTTERLGGEEQRLRVAYVHPTSPQVVGYDDPGRGFFPSLAAGPGGVLMTWRPDFGTASVAALLPLGAHEPEPVTYAAGQQKLIATASTPDAILAVWNETLNGEHTLRAGVRLANGDWSEREIHGQIVNAGVAASDGRDFVVIAGYDAGAAAWFLNSSGRVTNGPVALPMWPLTIAWTGTDYVIANGFSIARLSRSGVVSGRVELPYVVQGVAWNGTAVMAVLAEPEPCPILCPGVYGMPRFAQLGADLRPIGEPRLIEEDADNVTEHVEVVWDGSRFVAAWLADGRLKVAELPLTGEATIVATVESSSWSEPRMAAVEGGVAVAWRDAAAPDGYTLTRVITVDRDDRLRSAVLDPGGHWITGQPFVVAMPNGRIGHLASIPRYDPPHHGSSRVVLRVAGALPQRPDAPRLVGVVRNGKVELAWTAPPQEVAGYRIEYRIGDGAWNELDRWFDANDDRLTLTWQLRRGVAYQFRIRALNDAGPSDASAPVVVNLQKRRAVR